ncbi:tape measure protein [Enterococcus dispar]|uniref:tape measure protein n=1 Tax=Enterococcus dispar TaxID=44009 RepID=UPI0021D44E90|nr:tape measure protein [Enterococcus dispar]MCU7356692.1 tape measure protein [Enterococcus dispar]
MADYTLSAKITGDASGFKGMIANAQAGLDSLQSKFASTGSKLQSIGKNISGVGDKLTSKITKPAVAATSALAGVTLVKGFNRLAGIDTAKAKLMGLGHDAKSVESIMNNATESVRGTAFGLDEAATTAAGAVAAGVKPGKELTKYLTNTADAAAIAGTSMSEMGSIMNKVQTGGKAMTENLEQLSDRGLPIYQWLAKEANVAASEVKDMASQGKISSEMFLAAIEKNIGGAAKIMGEKSFTAAVANVGAAIGRIGANFLDAGGKGGGFFSQLKPLMASFTESLGTLEAKAADLGVKFGEAFANIVSKAQELKAKFDGLDPSVQKLIIKGALIGGAIAVGIGPALKIIGTLTTGFGGFLKVLSMLASPIGLIGVAIVGLGVAFGVAMAKSESFREKVGSLAESIGKALTGAKLLAQGFITLVTAGEPSKFIEIGETFRSMFPDSMWQKMLAVANGFIAIKLAVSGLVGIFTGSISSFDDFEERLTGPFKAGTIQKIYDFGTKVKTTFDGIKETVGQFSSGITPLISSAFSQIGPLVTTAFSMIGPAISAVFENLRPVFETFGGIIQAILPSIQGLINEIGPKLQSGAGGSGGLITSIGMALMGINPIVKLVISAFKMFGPQIVQLVQQVAPMLTQTIGVIASAIIDLASTAIPIVMSAFQSFLPIIMQVGQVFMSALAVVLPVILNIITQLVPIIASLAQSFMQVVAQVMPLVAQLVGALVPVIGTIITTVMNIVTAVAPALMAIIGAIVEIIKAMLPVISSIIGVVISVVTNVISTITPIIAFIGTVITTIMSIISPIVAFVANIIEMVVSAIRPIIQTVSNIFTTVFGVITGVWNNVTTATSSAFELIGSIVSRISSVFSSVFNTIGDIVSGAMDIVSNVISNTFSAIQSAWEGLTGFVGGVFDGVSGAVSELVEQVKGFVNGVIGGINSAIGIINKIPGVNIGSIPYLQSGTTSFQGGFARMNEGGRGEMVVLPSGSQVIPHDASMKYAKEAARRTAAVQNYNDSESVVYDFRGMNDGATFVVREEADINRIAEALQKMQERAQRSKGLKMI